MDTNPSGPHSGLAQYANQVRVRVCGILLEGKKVLLVHHHHLHSNYNLWSPPGGGLAFGETVKECLVREFKEETGLDVVPGRFLFLQEFLQSPLQALELFFEVKVVGGQLAVGYDPELESDQQLIQAVAFKTLAQLRQENQAEVHRIFADLIDLDDLFIPANRFL